jgi:hypothetical protein
MKQIITTVAMALLLTTNAFSQCAPTTGNYEYSISNDAKSITIQARNTSNTLRISDIDAALKGYFAGLVFGIKWSLKSDLTLLPINTLAPFNINTRGKTTEKNNKYFQAYSDEADDFYLMPKEWLSGNWITIAIIPYQGMLSNGDHFEFTECGFDVSSDPYFSQMDNKDHYGQYAPKLLPNTSEVNNSVSNAMEVYPEPTLGNLYIDINSTIATRTTFQIMDLTGKIIKAIQSDLSEGLNKITIDVSDISNGMYLIKVTDAKALKFSQKFTKQ